MALGLSAVVEMGQRLSVTVSVTGSTQAHEARSSRNSFLPTARVDVKAASGILCFLMFQYSFYLISVRN